jgi:hypothetical protein
MLRGDLHFRALLNIETAPSAHRVKRHVNDCAAIFVRAYAPRSTRAKS